MGEATTLLFGLDGFRVVSVAQQHEHEVGGREVVVEGVVEKQACPDCGVLSGSVHSRRLRRIKDLPHGRRPLRVCWDQRRWACRERACRRRTCAETSGQVGAGQRLTRRLREQLERAVSGVDPLGVGRRPGVRRVVVVGEPRAGGEGRGHDRAGACWGADARGR